MKFFCTLFLLICAFTTQVLMAQAPLGFSYQAVARDINDDIIKDELISMRFWVIADNAAGSPVYRETHTGVYTGLNGVITRVIGTGTQELGSFAAIDWGSKNYFIRVDMDINGGSNFTQMGTSQLLSVPYAMFAQKAGNSGSGSNDNWGTQTVQSNQTLIGDGTASNPLRVDISEVNTDNQVLNLNGNQLSISNGNTVSLPAGSNLTAGSGINISNNVISNTGDNDNDPTNEIQQLSLSGTVLSLSNNGGSVNLPSSGGGDNWGTQTVVNDGITLSGQGTASSPIKMNHQNVSNGQILKSNGTTWIPGTDNDNQDLSNTTNNSDVTINISGGTSTTFSVQDDDASPTNELQNLAVSKTGSNIQLNITDGTGVNFNINDNDADPTNELQNLSNSKSGSNVTLNITKGNSTTFSVNDNDSSPTNELQSLSVSGTNLSISNGNTVPLPNGLWSKNPQFLGIHYLNEVSVGTNSVFGELNVNGRGVFFNEGNPTARTTINPNGTLVLTGDSNTKMNIGTIDRGRLELFNEDGRRTILLDRNSATGGSFIGLRNKFGNNETVQLRTRDDNGVGEIFTFAASKPIAGFTHLDGNPDRGYIGVINTTSNTFRAAMHMNAANQGVIFADIKNFRMDHPGRSDKEIWYASLEGPEAAAYERGTATLKNGEAFIPFSDHFGLVIIEKGMTVMLTPLDGSSLGLAVVEKTKNGFKVIELHSGRGNYSFDWEAKGVRAGFERYEVIRDKSDAQPANFNIKEE